MNKIRAPKGYHLVRNPKAQVRFKDKVRFNHKGYRWVAASWHIYMTVGKLKVTGGIGWTVARPDKA